MLFTWESARPSGYEDLASLDTKMAGNLPSTSITKSQLQLVQHTGGIVYDVLSVSLAVTNESSER